MNDAGLLRIMVPVIFWDHHVLNTELTGEKNALCAIHVRFDYSVVLNGTSEQIKHLETEAKRYAMGNKYHTSEMILAARVTVAAIQKAKEAIA